MDNKFHHSTSNSFARRPLHLPLFSRRRFVVAIRVLLACLSCLAIYALFVSHLPYRICAETCGPSSPRHCGQFPGDPADPLAVLKGPPTQSFQDNLRPEVKYISSWGSGGWTNDVIGNINLIYLALITDRVPIIPAFMPTHIGRHRDPIPFGEVFDVPHLWRALGKPVLEWREVKDPNSTVLDDLGCWNIWESVQFYEKFPRHSFNPGHVNLDISYTKTPSWIKMFPGYEHDRHSTFWSLAALSFPSARNANLVPALPSPLHNVSLEPDDHLLCYDFLYYVAAHQSFEFSRDYSPAWRYVGQHMRWLPALEQVALQYTRRAFGLDGDVPIPPFISVHVRRNDFKSQCRLGVALEDCFASLPVIARRVREVQAEIQERKGIVVSHVIVTSDEKNGTWWGQVEEQGWYPILIDAVIQSQGVGFVGTDMSTVSALAWNRVKSWQDGPVRMVKWGAPNADDH
ncbi:hypothetical protein B0H10DRAFT_2352825 [Mycena sp. CBHHK59/15]|nr:hypothetical protein B0H10DRAFT_2352825 [Mycena sp. CBHHK59/15]